MSRDDRAGSVNPPTWLDERGPFVARAIIFQMPAPMNERQALERERAELPAHIANYQRELAATHLDQKERRERLAWQIRRVEKRMAEIGARLAGS
jgi:hypothetical protein